MIIFSHAKSAEGAKILSPFLFTLALEESQTSLRREGAESLSTPPPCGVLAPVSGGESVTTISTAPANCPPETGWTSEAEGVDYTFSIPPLPLRPLSRVASDYSSESVVLL